MPISAEESGSVSFSQLLQKDLFGKATLKEKDIVGFSREMATMLGAGLPLDRALGVLGEKSDNPAFSTLVEVLLGKIKDGSSFANALETQTEYFPGYYIAMVRAGEAGGSLDKVMARLSEFMQRSLSAKEAVKSAMVYPIILAITAAASIVILLAFILPEFTPIFEDAGTALPLATRIVVSSSQWLASYWWLIAFAILLSVLGFKHQLQQPKFRLAWDSLMLRVPLYGDLLTRIGGGRVMRVLGTLLGNGVPLDNALQIAQKTAGNAAIEEAIGSVDKAVREGRGLAQPLEDQGFIPSFAIQLVRVGEETGRLAEMLENVADIFEEESKRSIDRMMAALVPVMTIILGLVVSSVIISVLMAILSVNDLAF